MNDILPVYRNLYMKFDEHDYGMVYDGDTHLLFYRKDVFEKYSSEYKQMYNKDLKPPSTWKEYDQIAKFLTRIRIMTGKLIYMVQLFLAVMRRGTSGSLNDFSPWAANILTKR